MIQVSIPVYNPSRQFYDLLDAIRRQSIQDIYVIIINSGDDCLDKAVLSKYRNLDVVTIKNQEFDHGGTRNLAARQTDSEYIVFMTQDAMPTNNQFIEELIFPFSDPDVAAVYGRQIANSNAKHIERFARMFNYPEVGLIKTKADIDTMGIKAFFLTDVCAAYRRRDFDAFGGFPEKIICNEDMILSSKFILGDKKTVYNPKAEVYHSHNYSYIQQFRRNFDIGVSLKENSEILQYSRPEKEGFQFVKRTLLYCFEIKKPYLIVDLIFESVFKFIGYKMGMRFNNIPNKLCKYFSYNKSYWT